MKERHYLLRSGTKDEIIPTRIFDRPDALRAIANPLGFRIFQSLSSPRCPMDIARKIGEHEQKVYYYINKFRKHGLIEEVGSEKRKGTLAKFYQSKGKAFAFKMGDVKWRRLEVLSHERRKSLEPFVSNGKADFTIVVGSPDPHGPWKERALDSPTAIDLALFIGSFVNGRITPNYRLDTEMQGKDFKSNLILVGGPLVNMVTRKVNSSLPVNFDMANKNIVSRISKNVYRDDQFGLISLVENPWNRSKKVLVFAGKRFPGTRAAIIAFINDPEKIMKGNRFDKSKASRVVRGYDTRGKGIIDTAEIME